jgi:hypothetical protein
MKRINLASLAASLAIPLTLGACAVYEPAPAYPAYGYGPGSPRQGNTYVFRGDFSDNDRDRGRGRGHDSHHHRGHWR